MIQRYSHANHLPQLKLWLDHYNIALPQLELLSDRGFVSDDVAIGFLVTTNSRQYMIDHVVADPFVNKERRDAALNNLFRHLVEEASKMGAKMVTALAVLPQMKSRFEALGFMRHGTYDLYFKGGI